MCELVARVRSREHLNRKSQHASEIRGTKVEGNQNQKDGMKDLNMKVGTKYPDLP